MEHFRLDHAPGPPILCNRSKCGSIAHHPETLLWCNRAGRGPDGLS
jgi:hypothetical protein